MNLFNFENLICEACKKYELAQDFVGVMYFMDMPGNAFPIENGDITEKDERKKACEKLLKIMVDKEKVFMTDELNQLGSVRWNNGISVIAGHYDGTNCIKILGYALNKLGLIDGKLLRNIEKL